MCHSERPKGVKNLHQGDLFSRGLGDSSSDDADDAVHRASIALSE